jgi:hypothetical protein
MPQAIPANRDHAVERNAWNLSLQTNEPARHPERSEGSKNPGGAVSLLTHESLVAPASWPPTTLGSFAALRMTIAGFVLKFQILDSRCPIPDSLQRGSGIAGALSEFR